MINNKMAKILRITSGFSTLVILEAPRDNNQATIKIETVPIMSIVPPLETELAMTFGILIPKEANSPLKFDDKPAETKAKHMKYSASKAQPANQPQNSQNKTLIQVNADPAKGIADAISA